jgi:autotransporter-associated beta strand protein
VAGGVLKMGNASALGAATNNFTLSGGTLDLNGNSLIGGTVVSLGLGSGTITDSSPGGGTISATVKFDATVTGGTDRVTIEVPLAGAAYLVKAGDGAIELKKKNTYTGGTTVSGGSLILSGGDNTLLPNTAIFVTGGTLDLGGSTQDAANAVVQLTRGVVQNGTLSKNSGSFEALVVSGDTVTLANNARLQGTGAILVKNGDGKLVLAGTNAHGGGTVINAGVVEVGSPDAFGTGVVDFQGGLLQGTSPGQVIGNRIALSGEAVFAGNLVLTGTVSGAGALIVDATGKTVALNAASTFAADITLNNGELSLGADQTTSGAVQLKQGTVSGSGTLTGSNGIVVNTAAAANKVTVGPNAKLSGNLVKTGDGTLELLSDQRNLGAVTLNQGTVSGSGKTLTASSGITVNTAASADVVTVTVGTKLSGNLNKTGDGTLVLNGSLVLASGLSVNGGKVDVGTAGKIGPSGPVALNNGELNLQSNQSTSGAVTLNKGTVSGAGRTLANNTNGIAVNTAAVGDTVTVGANLSGKVSKTGDGTLVLNGSLVGVAPGASDVAIDGGKVVVGATGKLGPTGAVTLTKGELNLGSDQTTGSVTLREGTVSGEGKTLQAAALSVDTDANKKVVVDAKLGGTLTKVGEGTLLLNSSNAALEAVTVSRGTVVVGADNALGTKSLTVNAGGILDLGQFDQATTGATIEGSLRNGAVDAGSATVTVKTGANVNNVALKAANGTVDLSGGAVTGSVVEAGAVKLGEVDVVGGKLASTSQIAASMAVKRTVGADITSLNGLKKAGVGELILSGNNAGMSGLDVTAGTVTVSGQQALGRGDIRVDSGATLKAPGAVAQPAAKFEVNGEFSAQLLEVGGGKTVSGVGTVNAGVLLSANGAQTGAIAPGNSVGSLSVGYLSGTGDYIWERTAPPIGGPVGTPGSDYDQIVLGGPGQLQGITVRPRNDSGVAIPAVSTDPGGESLAYDQVRVDPYKSLRYSKIIDGAVSGTPLFAGSDTAVIKIRLERTDGTLGSAPGIDLVVDRSSYSQFGRGKSGRAFGAYLDSQLSAHYDQNTAIGGLLRNLDATASAGDVSAYLRAVDPGAAYASLYNVGLRRAHTAAVPLEDRLDLIGAAGATDSALQLAAGVGSGSPMMIAPAQQPDDDRNWTAWTSGQSSVLRTNAKADFGTIQSSDNGASVGMEHQIGNLRIGGLASFGQGSATFGSPALRVESDHWHVGGYGSVAFGAVTVDASALFGSSDESSTRSVAAGSARGNFGSTDSQVGVGVALNLVPKTSGWQVTPVARLKYVSYKQDAVAESGPGGALLFNTGSINEDTVLSKVGFRVAHSSEVSKSFKLGLDGAAYWVHDFNSEGRNVSLALQGANGAFQATGRNGQANTAQLNLGVQAILADSVTVRLSGQQEVGANRYQSTGVFAVGWNF